MNKEQFINAYVVNFMATYTAFHYDDNCLRDKHKENMRHACVEDAQFLAEYAWKAYIKCESLTEQECN